MNKFVTVALKRKCERLERELAEARAHLETARETINVLMDQQPRDHMVEDQPVRELEVPLKADTAKMAYLHNHGHTVPQITQMTFREKTDACVELAKKLGKVVLAT